MDYIYVIDGGTNVIEDYKMIISKRQRGNRYDVKYDLFSRLYFQSSEWTFESTTNQKLEMENLAKR